MTPYMYSVTIAQVRTHMSMVARQILVEITMMMITPTMMIIP